MSASRLLVVNPNTDPRITAWLAQEARRVAAPGVVVEAINADSGLAALETPEHVESAAAAVLRAITQRRPAAALIGAFGDPGLDRCGALGLPVVGLGECGLRVAGAAGGFAIITLGEAMRASIAARVELLGLSAGLREIRVLAASIPEFVNARDTMTLELAAEVRVLTRAGARCVLLAGAPFAGLAHKLAPDAADGVESCLTALGLCEPRPRPDPARLRPHAE